MADEVRFITPRMLASHARTCKKDNCIRCAWHRCGDALRKRFVFKRSSHGSMPWLVLAMQWSKKCKTSLGVGCVVCYRHLTSLQQKRDGFTSAAVFAALSLQPHPKRGLTAQCQRHENSHFHKQSLLRAVSPVASLPLSALAPPVAEFQKCLIDMRKGRSARHGGGSSDKTYLMRWCLTEAMQDQHRAAARQSSSVVLIRDERRGKMMVRFRLCESKTLNVRSGVLALETLSCGQAEEILRATRRGLTQFCQSRRNPPRGFRGHVSDFDEGLFKKLRQNCQMVVTDCASSELLAQNIGAGSRKSSAADNEDPLFPAQKIIGRDRAHASQRLLSRPWSEDPELRDLMEDMMGISSGLGCKALRPEAGAWKPS